jgi:chemotaxis protein methyltransferase CheR
VLDRARAACYSIGSLRQMPTAWREQAFTHDADRYCLRAEYLTGVDFSLEDIHLALPPDLFQLILCRNLVFTYFDESLQRQTLERILTRLRPGGALVIGRRETLPSMAKLTTWSEDLGIFRKLP